MKKTAIKTHKLKVWKEYYADLSTGKKTFELRKNDRDYKVGDQLDLFEYDKDKNEFTGDHCHRFITHILGANQFVDLGDYVILGLSMEYANQQQPFPSNEEIEKWYPFEDENEASTTKSLSRILAYNTRQLDRREGAKRLRDNYQTSEQQERMSFKDWYKKKFDPKGFLYPSVPIDIGFEDMCDRVEEYLSTKPLSECKNQGE